MRTLRKVISGGQTGVDRAALRAARAVGLEIGGWCPPGRVSADGPIPAEFPLRETPSERSTKAPDIPRSLRSEWNVRDADATLILTPAESLDDPGTAASAEFTRDYDRPLLICDPSSAEAAASIIRWLEAGNVEMLNVAGPSEAAAPGIGDVVYSLLTRVFTNCVAETVSRTTRDSD